MVDLSPLPRPAAVHDHPRCGVRADPAQHARRDREFFVLPIASSIVFNLVSALEDIAPWIDLGTAQEPLFTAFEDTVQLTGAEYAQLGTTTLIWIVVPFVAGWFRVMRAELK